MKAIRDSTKKVLGIDYWAEKEATNLYGDNLDRTELKRLEKRSKVRIKNPNILPKRVTEEMVKVLKGRKLPQLSSYYEKLHARRMDRLRLVKEGETPKPILYSWKESLAFLSFDLAPSYGLSKRIIDDVMTRVDWTLVDEDDGMRTMLDFGSGVGSAVLAAQDNDTLRKTLDEATLVDPSRSMWEIAQSLIEPPADLRRPVQDILADLRADARTRNSRQNMSLLWSPSLPELVQGLNAEDYPQYDMVTAMFSLSELQSSPARAVALGMLWKLVKPGGVLIVAERGDSASRMMVMDARELLVEQTSLARGLTRVLSMNPFRGSKVRIVAPCLHSNSCPLLRDDLPEGRYDRGCQFVQSIGRTVTTRGNRGQGQGRKTSTFAYSYFAAQKIPLVDGEADPADNPSARNDIESLENSEASDAPKEQARSANLSEYSKDKAIKPAKPEDAEHDESSMYEVEENKKNSLELDDAMASRIIRHPLVRKGHVTLDLCQADGNINRLTLTKSKVRDRVYRSARKASWGGVWMDVNPPMRSEELAAEANEKDDDDVEEDEEDDDRSSSVKTAKNQRSQRRRDDFDDDEEDHYEDSRKRWPRNKEN